VEAPHRAEPIRERVRWEDVRASSHYGSWRAWEEVDVEVVDDE